MDLPNSPEAARPEAAPSFSAEEKEAKERQAEREPRPEPEPAPEKPVEPAVPAVALPETPEKAAMPERDEYYQRVERVLEDNLIDAYLEMPKDQRLQFKQEGERVAGQLRQMIESAKVKAKEVLKIIGDWLKRLPGVSRWFLEQEAKIKTDRIIQLAEERRKEKEGL